jgi:hypothetical protein
MRDSNLQCKNGYWVNVKVENHSRPASSHCKVGVHITEKEGVPTDSSRRIEA